MTMLAANRWAPCFKETLLLALPVLGAHLIEALIPFFNITFAASLGETSLAAAGLVGSTFLAIMGFCWGVTASVGIIAATKIGENLEQSKIGLILWAGFFTTMILSLPVMVLFGYMDKIWAALGQDPQVVAQANLYMSGLLWAVPADLAKFALFQFAIACGKPRIPLIANIISIPLLAMITTGLIQSYGMYGIGLGTAITYWIIFIAMFAYMLMNPLFKNYLLHWPTLKECIQTCKAQLKLGIPIGLMFSIELIFFMVLTLLMGYFGTTSLAANQIAMQWMWLTVMLVYGFTEAVTILVAKANGAQNRQQIIQSALTGTLMAAFCMLVIACIYWFAPQWIISLDVANTGENAGLIQLATKLLIFCGIYQIIDSLRIVISGALRGLEDSQYPMWVTAFSFWIIGLPIAYTCAFLFNLQETGLWIGLLSAVIISTVLQYYRLQRAVSVKPESNTAIQTV